MLKKMEIVLYSLVQVIRYLCDGLQKLMKQKLTTNTWFWGLGKILISVLKEKTWQAVKYISVDYKHCSIVKHLYNRTKCHMKIRDMIRL